MNYIVEIITAIGAALGGGWLHSLYMARPQKESLEIENLKSVINIMGDDNKNYRERTDATIKELEAKIEELTQKVDSANNVIFSAYDCPLTQKASECIVLKTYRSCNNCTNDNGDNRQTV